MQLPGLAVQFTPYIHPGPMEPAISLALSHFAIEKPRAGAPDAAPLLFVPEIDPHWQRNSRIAVTSDTSETFGKFRESARRLLHAGDLLWSETHRPDEFPVGVASESFSHGSWQLAAPHGLFIHRDGKLVFLGFEAGSLYLGLGIADRPTEEGVVPAMQAMAYWVFREEPADPIFSFDQPLHVHAREGLTPADLAYEGGSLTPEQWALRQIILRTP